MFSCFREIPGASVDFIFFAPGISAIQSFAGCIFSGQWYSIPNETAFNSPNERREP